MVIAWEYRINLRNRPPLQNLLPKKVTYKFDREDYNEGKISKRIEKFLVSYPITFAEVTTLEEIGEFLKPPLQYMEALDPSWIIKKY